MNTPLDSYLAGVDAMANKAGREYGPFVNVEHCHGVLLEEIAEYFDEVRKKEHRHDPEQLCFEAIDIGAVAFRFLKQCDVEEDEILEWVEDKILNSPYPHRPQHCYYSMLISVAIAVPDPDQGPSALRTILAIAGAAYIASVAMETLRKEATAP